jgi:hypothetical protein
LELDRHPPGLLLALVPELDIAHDSLEGVVTDVGDLVLIDTLVCSMTVLLRREKGHAAVAASSRCGMRAQRLTTIIFIGMLLGIAVDACHQLWPDPQTAKTIAGYNIVHRYFSAAD